jgi:hypothetical protein
VKRTTPDLLASTKAFKEVVIPSCVSISPPKPPSERVSPAFRVCGRGEVPCSFPSDGFSRPTDLSIVGLFSLAFVFFPGVGMDSEGALRFLSSTIVMLACVDPEEECREQVKAWSSQGIRKTLPQIWLETWRLPQQPEK